jgi:protein TonB
MRPDLFGTVVRPPASLGRRKPCLLSCSVVIHVLVAAAVIAAPVLAPAVLPLSPTMIVYQAAAPIPAPPPPPAHQAAGPAPATGTGRVVPLEAPSGFRPEAGLVEPEAGREGGVEGGVPDGIVEGGLGLPAEPPPPAAPLAPLRPGGDLRPPARIKSVQPAYPPLAQDARVQGVVVIEAVIGTDGKVRDARVIRSIPLLDQAAVDAVLQWEYTPTRLNGVPVAIVMTVSVHFKLQ